VVESLVLVMNVSYLTANVLLLLAGSITVILFTYHYSLSLSLSLHSEATVHTQMIVSSNFFFPVPASPFYTRRNNESIL
jgi:hypothetical protein